jgi:8-oxo-dGTP pyrophosphatase MutT (NUDIX family)
VEFVTTEDLPLAATVVLVRDAATGPEVLLLRRPDRGSFAGAWVFPGGRLESDDSEQAGPGASEEEVARRAALRETYEEVGLDVALEDLTTVSCWVPPTHAAPRFRTWFFVAPAPTGKIVEQETEVVEHLWISPAEALRRHGAGELLLFPPTWITLYGFADQQDAATVIAEVRFAGIRRFETSFHAASPKILLWSEDAEYGPGRNPEARHRIEMDRLPWVYTRQF